MTSSVLWLQRGTLGYMAPELMGYKHDEDESNSRHPVTMAVDIYSFGLLLWAIITGEKPRMHDESLRKPRHATSQAWRLPGICVLLGASCVWHGHKIQRHNFLNVVYPGSDLLLWAFTMGEKPQMRDEAPGQAQCGRHVTCLAVRPPALMADDKKIAFELGKVC